MREERGNAPSRVQRVHVPYSAEHNAFQQRYKIAANIAGTFCAVRDRFGEMRGWSRSMYAL